MSTLKTNTLSNLAGSQSTPIENAINGSAKAWVNFNGTGTVAIRASHNVSSITDNSTGDYTVNFTTALADANYSNVVTASPDYAAGLSICNIGTGTSGLTESAPTSSSFRFVIAYYTGTRIDAKYICASAFR